MSQTITRMFATHENAAAAVADLKQEYFRQVYLVSRPEGDGSNSGAAIVASITAAFVLKADAEVLAEGVNRGGTLVIVHAPFGAALKAEKILASHHPIPSGLTTTAAISTGWDDAAPLSSALNLPVLIDNSAPFSRFWGLKILSDGPAFFSSWLRMPMLSSDPAPLSRLLSMPTLSNNPAPLSSLLGLRVLSERLRP